MATGLAGLESELGLGGGFEGGGGGFWGAAALGGGGQSGGAARLPAAPQTLRAQPPLEMQSCAEYLIRMANVRHACAKLGRLPLYHYTSPVVQVGRAAAACHPHGRAARL